MTLPQPQPTAPSPSVFRWVWLGVQLTGELALLAILAWVVLRALTADLMFPVALLTTFAPIWQMVALPLLTLLVLADLPRPQRWLRPGVRLVGWLGVMLLAVSLFGGLFTPRTLAQTNAPTLRVLTYNIEGRNVAVDEVVAALALADADLVGIQELNPRLAALLAPHLDSEYPYQWLLPAEGTSGMALYSRYPFEPLDVQWEGVWVGRPQVVRVAVNGQNLTWVNAHFMVTNPRLSNGFFAYLRTFHQTFRLREQNAALMGRFLGTISGPVVLTADLNATDLHTAYATLHRAGLRDAWRDAGWGWGMTFPAEWVGPIPPYLVRIDYIFGRDVRFTHAERLPFDGVSDHLAVLAIVALETNP